MAQEQMDEQGSTRDHREKWGTGRLTGGPTLAQHHPSHFPEEATQRWGNSEDRGAVAGVGWQSIRGEALAEWKKQGSAPVQRPHTLIPAFPHLGEEIVLQKQIQTGTPCRVGSQQAGDEAPGVGGQVGRLRVAASSDILIHLG